MRNGSVTPMEEGSAKQAQVMLLREWSADDVASRLIEIDVMLEPWIRRYSGKKCLKFMVSFPTDLMSGVGANLIDRIAGPWSVKKYPRGAVSFF